MKDILGKGSMLLLGASCLALASCSGGSSKGSASDLPLGWVPAFGPGSSPTSEVRSLAVFDDGSGSGPALFAAGDFQSAGGETVNRIAKWDGSTWSALGTGTSATVLALRVFDDGSGEGPALYVAGGFSSAGGTPASRIARWNGSDWSALGAGASDAVFALAVFDDGSGGGPALYAGGNFITAGEVAGTSRIARWDGTGWSALGTGTDSTVFALAVFDDGSGDGPALYAGGQFTAAGGVPGTSRIAKWDGTTWSALGTGMDAAVWALTVFDDGEGPALYAGGDFATAGGTPAMRMARWDGSTWSALGTGVDSQVQSLAVFDDGSEGGPALYVGGAFSSAGGVQANRIARWDGSAWSALGAGVNSAARALGVFDDGSSSGGIPHGPSLFVGGFFSESPAGDPFLAKWGRSQDAVLSGPEGAQQLTSLQPGGSHPEEQPCALTARIGAELVLDDPEAHLLLEHARVAPLRDVRWLRGTIELRGGRWSQAEPLVLGVAGPARLVLAEGARLEIPRVIIGPQGELAGAGRIAGDLENQGLVAPCGAGLELGGRYLEAPPGNLNGELHRSP